MRKRPRVRLTPRDVSVLALSRAILEAHGPMSDVHLVERLVSNAIPVRDSRESLARLEEDRQLTFGASGWTLPTRTTPTFPDPYPW